MSKRCAFRFLTITTLASTMLLASCATAVPDDSAEGQNPARSDEQVAGVECGEYPLYPEIAATLPTVGDCDWDGKVVSGSVELGESADGTVVNASSWYRFSGTDGACFVTPSVDIASGDVGLAVHFSCDAGTTSFTCPEDTFAHTTILDGEEVMGCVGNPGQSVALENVACTGTVYESGTVYVNVISDAQLTCEEYTLYYNF